LTNEEELTAVKARHPLGEEKTDDLQL
jgi:hypothetical protein